MKKNRIVNRHWLVFLCIAAACVAAGCSGTHVAVPEDKQSGAVIDTSPVTIRKQGNSSDITSYQTNVKVFQENSRLAGGRQQTDEYRLSMKLIDARLYTRIDYNADDTGMARSVICSPEELCVFDRNTNTVAFRTPMEQEDTEDSKITTLFGRMNLDEVRSHYSDMSFRITEGRGREALAIEVPQEYLADFAPGNASMVSEIYYFDTTMEVPSGYEYTVVDENNVRIKTVETSLYQEVDGVPILTGKIIEESYTYPYKLDTSDRLIPILENPESLPIMTEEDVAELREQGGDIFFTDAVLGDPGNLDHVITTVERYEAIELNSLQDSWFRLNI